MARFTGPISSGNGGDANIADFIFTNIDEDESSITLPINKEMTIETTRDDDGDADINITAADDVFITANGDDIRLNAFNSVEVSSGDGNNTWTFGNGGGLDLPNSGNIYNPGNTSGDGLGAPTLQINPASYLGTDQYIILDPTTPNHIHIRAGGNIDESSAELILGGEKTNVKVSDGSNDVQIKTHQTVEGEGGPYDNEYYWAFGNDGTLYGPAMGGLIVTSLSGAGQDYPLSIYSNDRVLLNGANGEFLNDPEDANNQIATIGDIADQVSTGLVRYSPTFSATGLTFTGSGATYPTYNSYYVKSGKMVSFVIEVDCSTVTNFGTGQFKLQLPFTPAIGYNHFTGWAQVDIVANPDVADGHVILNVDHAGVTDILDLHYLKQAGGAHTPIIEGLFLQGTPVTLTTSSKIYVNGTYIAA